MKKLSLSVLALLAIVFAVTSAFTSVKQVKHFDTPQWYLADGTFTDEASAARLVDSYLTDSPVSDPTEDPDGNGPEVAPCPGSDGNVCAAFFDKEASEPISSIDFAFYAE